MPNEQGVPVYQEYMNPILNALRAREEGLTIAELETAVVKEMQLRPEVLAIPHKPDEPGRSEVSYRITWARTYLKKAGFIDNPSRGVWALTASGIRTREVDPYEISSRIQAQSAEAREDATLELDLTSGLDLPPLLESELRHLYHQMNAEGLLLSEAELAACYEVFRQRFGPQVLSGLDGERLLLAMHERNTHESLVYWLEFKDDEELPDRFGSIAGGSALKFGIYQSADTGHWMTGTAAAQVRLTLEQAIDKAREQKRQLVAGAGVLETASRQSRSVDYATLQRRIVEAAPDVAETAWGHKYFALLFPNLLDDFHSATYQAFHLIKLLQTPRDGRYANAGLFMEVARRLGIHVSNLGSVLNQRNGTPHQYWRIGTGSDGTAWRHMRDGEFAAIGWTELGDLSNRQWNTANKPELRARMEAAFPSYIPSQVGKSTEQVYKLLTVAQDGDTVVAMHGTTVHGVGRIVGGYYYSVDECPFGHRRPVDWLATDEWDIPTREGLQTTFYKLGKHADNLIEIERHILASSGTRAIPSTPAPPVRSVLAPLAGVAARVQAGLQRKRQVVLYGPPGTGKTHWAEVVVHELAARAWFGKSTQLLDQQERETMAREEAIVLCSFHPGFGYEDFIEGYRPVVAGGQLAFEKRDGIFKQLCKRAERAPLRSFYLLIDEINRGDVPRIFGDMITILEKDKRGKQLRLALSGDLFAVPENVYIVATMNTADRSIALLDAALRRRFAFVDLIPDSKQLAGANVGGLPLGAWLDELNRRIVENTGRDGRHLQVGHAYLLAGGMPITEVARFAEVLRDDIIPLLEEYCYEDFTALARILGTAFVDSAKHRVHERLFDSERHDELIRALLSSFDSITATTQAVVADRQEEEDDDDSEPGVVSA